MKETIKKFDYGPELLEDFMELEDKVGAKVIGYRWFVDTRYVEVTFGEAIFHATPLTFINPEFLEIFTQRINYAEFEQYWVWIDFRDGFDIDWFVDLISNLQEFEENLTYSTISPHRNGTLVKLSIEPIGGLKYADN